MAAPSPTVPIRYDAFQKCFKQGERHIPGLLKLLADRFYPTYSFTKAIYNAPAAATTEYKRRLTRKQDTARVTGVNLGIQLDKQITTTVNVLIRLPDTPLRVFWDASFLSRAPLPEWARSDCTGLSIQTKAFWKAIHALKLHPTGTQVVVSSSYGRRQIATAVDVECLDKSGAYVLIEVKCGFTGYYTNCTQKRMAAPLSNMTDSLANQHQLQLAATCELYRNTFPDRTLGTCIVLHVEGPKVSRYTLKPDVKLVRGWTKLLLQ